MAKKAVFLDRDGTLIPDTGAKAADPNVEPLPGAVPAVAKLHDAHFLAVVVTNQSGVARGYYTEDELAAAHRALMKRFEDAGAPLDGLYYCPHLPDGQVAEYAVECDCRKPKPGLILRAADELGIDIGASYIVGDAERDIVAGRAAGCKGAALIRPESAAADDVETDADVLVPGVETAVNWIRHIEKTENE